MAIDFMIMPLSRYISGDFITPTMRLAWDQGVPYSIFGPDGRKDYPAGEPFGGASAPQRRAAIQTILQEDLRALPPNVACQLWDEQSNVEPRFHRVDPTSYQALVEQAASKKVRPSLFGFLKRQRPATPHVTATLFLPCEFDEIFAMSSPFDRITGSMQRSLQELSSNTWGADAQNARETFSEALRDAMEARLPMIVDW
ncbi:hypothetical protein [Polyangium sp. 6x1]|uniref:hypothetical protein n=1 Tax=Polyangium sp. 6x1 TaxID=3042689 RepID=UPI0024831AE1|nr:hypothetical protein [Polyangium sp. 6x1]MDI1451095.1 hypothetical protein [Polyangium sp. 6x1]